MLAFLLPRILLLSCALLSPLTAAQNEEEPAEITSFNYVYSAVLGTGYYTTGAERALVVRIPFSFRLAPLNEKNRFKLLFPLALGVRDVFNENGDLEIPDQLLTASFLPGFAWERYMRDKWILTPTFQLGFAKDMQFDTEAWLYSIALRSFAWWDIGKHRLGLGNRLLGASQFINNSGDQTGFVLLESGLDWEYPIPGALFGHPLSTSLYLIWQHYADDVNIDAVSGEVISLENVFKLGFTFGFRKNVSFFGLFNVRRVGIAVGRGNTVGGNEIKSVTLNLGFPLSYD